MIGNDIVDLDDPETGLGATHARFDERAFTLGERDWITGSDEPRVTRWTIWAAKEASYKLARAERPDTVFSPRKFEVSLASPGSAIVHQHERREHPIEVELDVRPAWVHAIARRPGRRRGIEVTGVSERVGDDPSRSVRALALKALSPRFADADELRIGRRAGGAPHLVRRERPVAASLSFSHHGRFVAFACELHAQRSAKGRA